MILMLQEKKMKCYFMVALNVINSHKYYFIPTSGLTFEYKHLKPDLLVVDVYNTSTEFPTEYPFFY